jgi:hypothetical protein
MINRISKELDQQDERQPESDYWVVEGDVGWFYVTRETAQRVARLLGCIIAPRWLAFVDLFGAEVRVRSRDIARIGECTGPQRSAKRSFQRARRREEKEARHPWEDDDVGFWSE